jgi:hypothetical protein
VGKVSFADYLFVEHNFAWPGNMTWADGDFNGDGKVSFADYLLLEHNFGKSNSSPAPAPVATALAVPTTVTAAKTTSPDAVQSVQAQTLALIGWKAVRPTKSFKFLRQVDFSLTRSLLALVAGQPAS